MSYQENKKSSKSEVNTSESTDYSYKAYIKDIFLELPGYKYHHSPLDGDDDSENFIGREKVKKKFVNVLTDSENNGAYLITGYRGMGKTSFVKSVLETFEKQQNETGHQIGKINISFAQFDLKERDILKQVTNSLIEEAEKNIWVIANKYISLASVFRFIFFILFILLIFYKLNFDQIKDFNLSNIISSKENPLYSTLSIFLILVLFSITITYVIFFLKKSLTLLVDIKKSNIKNKRIKRKHSDENGVPYFKENILEYIAIIVSCACILIFSFNNSNSISSLLIVPLICIFLLYRVILNWNYYLEKIIQEKKLYDRLTELYERCNATVTNEVGANSNSSQLPFGFISKNIKVYPIATPKEIEYELIQILKEYDSFKKYKRKFVFVFDELDKVEPSIGKGYYYDDAKTIEQYDLSQNQLNELRERKKIILNILASLKYFITEAKARFIFIAGREMFDASLADIADRQSSISSIFNQIIYIDSFLKDELKEGSSGLTDLVEAYFIKALIPPYEIKYDKNDKSNKILKINSVEISKNDTNKNDYENLLSHLVEGAFLVKYSAYLAFMVLEGKLKDEERIKILFTLQNFIIYLTYRSNGSPKKLVKILEDYIVKGNIVANNKSIVANSKLLHFDNSESSEEKKKEIIYLKLNYKAQYKFGFITYLYRPFLLAYSQFIKKYSDYVLVSTPYLMDHLIKFHPFAFSVQNLELLPEVLSANRNPILRFFIEEIIFFLNQNHIRETEISLFDYKFYNKSSNEIIYLSKIFEEESAAFNFTLDETYFIKLYLRSKIKELRNNHRDFKNPKEPTFIYSVSYLNGLLGDAYYFDQEFDDAIVSYLDGLQFLREESTLSIEKFIMLLQFKLKLGLVHEKIKSYESAISYYNDVIINAQDFVIKYGKGEFKKNSKDKELSIEGSEVFKDVKIILGDKFKEDDGQLPSMISMDELLQVISQAYIASLYIHEKLSIAGVTLPKLSNYQEAFKKIVGKAGKKDGENKLIRSNYYSNIATMLYYKNLAIKRKKSVSTNGIHLYNTRIKTLVSNSFDSYKSGITIYIKDKYEYEPDLNNLKFDKDKYENNNKDYRFSFYSFLTYKGSLELLFNEWNNKSITLKDLCRKGVNIICGKNHYENIHNKANLLRVASLFSRIGDSLYTTMDTSSSREKSDTGIDNLKKGKILPSMVIPLISKEWNTNKDRPMVFLDRWLKKYSATLDSKHFDDENDINIIIFMYYLSGRLFSKAGKSVSLSFQVRKIIQIISNCVEIKHNHKDQYEIIAQKHLLNLIEEAFLPMILEVVSWNSNSTDRPQIYKYKHLVRLEKIDSVYHPPGLSKHIYSNISNSPESKEAILLFALLKVKSTDFAKSQSIGDCINCPEQSLVHQYNGISTQFCRILEFDLQNNINRALLKTYIPQAFIKKALKDANHDLINTINEQGFSKYWEEDLFKIHKKYNPNDYNDKYKTTNKNEIEKVNSFINKISNPIYLDVINEYSALITNSIFCLRQIISIIKIYDINYYLSYSYLAHFHKELGIWLQHYKLCQELYKRISKALGKGFDEINILDKNLENQLGKEAMTILDATSQFQIALQLYHKAKEIHSNGPAYHSQINNFIYLEDDFNDNLYHFGVALERQRLNSYKIREQIKRLEGELKDSPLYKYSSYTNNNEYKYSMNPPKNPLR